jgi:hypothetical protein
MVRQNQRTLITSYVPHIGILPGTTWFSVPHVNLLICYMFVPAMHCRSRACMMHSI